MAATEQQVIDHVKKIWAEAHLPKDPTVFKSTLFVDGRLFFVSVIDAYEDEIIVYDYDDGGKDLRYFENIGELTGILGERRTYLNLLYRTLDVGGIARYNWTYHRINSVCCCIDRGHQNRSKSDYCPDLSFGVCNGVLLWQEARGPIANHAT
jgi:hypothetical protein